MRSPAGTIVSVFPEHSSIFFVNTYSIINHHGASIVSGKTSRLSVPYDELADLWIQFTCQVLDLADTITSQGKVICHRTNSIFTAANYMLIHGLLKKFTKTYASKANFLG